MGNITITPRFKALLKFLILFLFFFYGSLLQSFAQDNRASNIGKNIDLQVNYQFDEVTGEIIWPMPSDFTNRLALSGANSSSYRSAVSYFGQDQDGVADGLDQDDDNDGILDINECNATGPEEVVNGTFQANFTSWTESGNGDWFDANTGGGNISAVFGAVSPAGVQSLLEQAITVVPNEPYEITFLVAAQFVEAVPATLDLLIDGELAYTATTEDVINDFGVLTFGQISLVTTFNNANPVITFRGTTGSGGFSGPDNSVDVLYVDNVSVVGGCVDTDNDGFPDVVDQDSDGDGIPDNIEAQETLSFQVSTGNDTDGDGLDNAYDTDNGGVQIFLLDSDADGTPDFLDLDSDDDGVPDSNESGLPSSLADSDGDGLNDAVDASNGFSVPNGIISDPATLQDSDEDVNLPGGDVDFRDDIDRADLDNDGVYDDVDLDDDNDGILDTVEGQCTPPQSQTWTLNGTSASYNFGNGITAVITQTGVNNVAAENFNAAGAGFWSEPLEGDASVELIMAENQSFTISFQDNGGNPVFVTNPIFNIDRVGGQVNGLQNALRFTLQGGLTWDLLASTDDLMYTSNSVTDSGAANGVPPGPDHTAQSSQDDINGTAAGTLRINGTISEFTINTTQVGPAGNDAFEIILAACLSTDTDGDNIPDFADVDSDGDGCFDALEGADNISFTQVDSDGMLEGAVNPSTGVPNDVNTTNGQAIGTSQNAAAEDSFGQCEFATSGEDTDGDGIFNIDDLDDDNDGILDVDECPAMATPPAAAVPEALNWVVGNYNVFAVGGNTNAQGPIESGFVRNAFENGYNVEILEGPDDYTVVGTVASFDGGTIALDDSGIPGTVDFADTVDGNFISGDAGDGIRIEGPGNAPAGSEYSVTYTFDDPLDYFSFDWVDIFDAAGGQLVRYEYYADGNLVGYLENNLLGGSQVGQVNAYDANGNLRGQLVAGQNTETTIGFQSEIEFSTITLRYTYPNGYTAVDFHGIDALTYRKTPVCDNDGDGVPNSIDLDNDNDGIYDVVENGNGDLDTNNDGRIDTNDNPSQGVGVNGVPDVVEDTPDSGTTDAPLNADGDALPNFLDIDADGDGIIDNIEGQTTDGYVAPNDTFTDVDGNGVDDIYDTNGTPIQPTNTDTFDQPDYLDINSDNDGDSDLIEAYDTNGDGVADITPTGTDSDNDGLDDAFDDVDLTVDDFQDNPDNNDQLPTDFPDDEMPGGDRDWRDVLNIDSDGDGIFDDVDLDDDNDGILDTDENGPNGGNNQPDCGNHTALSFDEPFTEESGDGDNNTFLQGEVFRFPNVANFNGQNVDALVTIVDLVNVTSIPTIDDNGSDSGSFKPRTAFTLANAGDRAYTEYRFDFVNSANGNPVVLEEFFVNFNDIDGNNNYSEQNWSQYPYTYTIDDPTQISTSTEGDFLIGTGGTEEFTGAGNTNPSVNYTTKHISSSSYTIRIGVQANQPNVSAGGRQHNVEFDCIDNYNNPQTLGLDSDGDGIPNQFDLDADNDGIYDIVENGNGALDTNNDGAADAADGQNVGANGVPDDAEDSPESGTTPQPLDQDTDGLPNFIDIDADNDGIIDNIEGQTTAGYQTPGLFDDVDNNGVDDNYDTNGTPIVPTDTDGDGLPDYLDTDSDNDTIPDNTEGYDVNMNGVADTLPTGLDSDNDGLDDAYDNVNLGEDDFQDNPDNNNQFPTDFPDDDMPGGDRDWREGNDLDMDGVPDVIDIDDDNDGIIDVRESPGFDADVDGDGVPAYLDDNDNDAAVGNDDGLVQPEFDFDGDGIANFQDLDSDGDGIPDNVEAQTTQGYTLPSGDGPAITDANGDGLDDAYDPDLEGLGLLPINTDGAADGPDYLDTNADNEGANDTIEAGLTLANADDDGDGLDNSVDTTVGYNDVNGTINDPALLPDTDNDLGEGGNVDFRDRSTPNDFDGDGIDNAEDRDDDNDGIDDVTEGFGFYTNGNDVCTGSRYDFQGGTYISGTGSGIGTVGARYRFPNAAPGLNAIVTVVSKPASVTINSIDFTDPADNVDNNQRSLQPLLTFAQNATGNLSVQLSIRLENSADNSPASVPRLGGFIQDIDSNANNGTVREFYRVQNATGYAIGNPTNVLAQNLGGSPQITQFIANNTGAAPVQPIDIDNRYRVFFQKRNVTQAAPLVFNIGAVKNTNTSQQRYYSIRFDECRIDLYNDPSYVFFDAPNTDGLAGPDYQDLDSDNDGCFDTTEAGFTDNTDPAFNDGILGSQSPESVDGNGLVTSGDNGDFYQQPVDMDNNGIFDFQEFGPDVNGNGIADACDDQDMDGIPDFVDIDDDNDGILDVVESPGFDADVDGDGVPAYLDDNDNNSAIGNDDGLVQPAFDFDGDGNANHLDQDADNDGIPDNVESQTTAGYTQPTGLDDDNDGLDNAYEAGGITPINFDGQDNPDYLDLDSDNDGVVDAIEGNDVNNDGIADIALTGLDDDNDGLDNAFDSTVGYGDPNGNQVTTNPQAELNNTDNDPEPDYRDLDDENDGVPTATELGDPNNPVDSDNDGTPDYLEVNDPELTLTKTSNATGNEVAGQTIIYTFSVENTGNVSVSSITVDDVLTGSTDLAISPGSLAPGETGTATANYIVSQADVDNGSIVNSASVEGTAIGNVTVTDISDNGDELVDDDNDGDSTNDPTVITLTQTPEL
ncbi:DUF7507 domain-containing protein, partial [Croceibacter atlanticus]